MYFGILVADTLQKDRVRLLLVLHEGDGAACGTNDPFKRFATRPMSSKSDTPADTHASLYDRAGRMALPYI